MLADRERLADAAVAGIIDSPFIGTGLDNFRYVAQKYHPQATPQQPHNMWLALMAETGVVGALAAAFLFITWFELLIRARSVHPRPGAAAFGMGQRELDDGRDGHLHDDPDHAPSPLLVAVRARPEPSWS